PRQLAAFAWLCALRDFDLQLIGVDQVIGGDTESPGGNLLDRAATPIAVRIALEALLVFPALAGIGFAANPVHGDRQGFVGFFANGAEGHSAGGEALDDFTGRLNLRNR